MRSFNSDMIIREELWQTFFTLFTCVDRMFSFKKFLQKFRQKLIEKNSNDSKKNLLNENLCPVCESEPTMAHCSIDKKCKHVFCYYCIKKELRENDDKFACPLCSKIISDVEYYIKNDYLN
jgi:hypothetical protein